MAAVDFLDNAKKLPRRNVTILFHKTRWSLRTLLRHPAAAIKEHLIKRGYARLAPAPAAHRISWNTLMPLVAGPSPRLY